MAGRKAVVLLGAGALGGPIAEACQRAGVVSLDLVDNGRVSPGVLVRQTYDDADVHRLKAEALRDRLLRIRPETAVTAHVTDVVDIDAPLLTEIAAADLLIDATASRMVSATLERARARGGWPPMLSVLIGHQAQRGIVTLADRHDSGGGYDVLRRIGIAARADDRLRDVADDFFPATARAAVFQPEPGCSEATFIGSFAEVGSLALEMLLSGTRMLAATDDPMAATIVRVSAGAVRTGIQLSWPNDTTLPDARSGMQIRLSATALAEIRAEARLGRRVRSPQVETGGTLLGQFDDAVGVVWVSAATGPPPDSRLSQIYFEHGVNGVEQTIEHWDRRSAGVIRFLGMWHSHPCGPASPSTIDINGMAELVLPAERAPHRALMIIVGGDAPTWSGFLEYGNSPDLYAEVVDRPYTPPRHTRWWVQLPAVEWWAGGYATSARFASGPAGGAMERARLNWRCGSTGAAGTPARRARSCSTGRSAGCGSARSSSRGWPG